MAGKSVLVVNTDIENKRFILDQIKVGLTIVALNAEKLGRSFVDHWILRIPMIMKIPSKIYGFQANNPQLKSKALLRLEDDVPLLAKYAANLSD